jgi:hypothetical protein
MCVCACRVQARVALIVLETGHGVCLLSKADTGTVTHDNELLARQQEGGDGRWDAVELSWPWCRSTFDGWVYISGVLEGQKFVRSKTRLHKCSCCIGRQVGAQLLCKLTRRARVNTGTKTIQATGSKGSAP